MTARKKPVRITVVTAERKIPAETLRFTPLGRQDRKAGGESLGKACDQKHDDPGGAHGRQGSGSHIPAHDDRIGHIIKLLEKVSQQKRYRKPQKDRQGPSLCHIRSHMTPRFLLISRFILAHPQKGCKWIFRRFTGRA